MSRETVKILITGDTHLGGGRVKEYAQQKDKETLFGEFLPVIKNSDLSITNLESPVIDKGEPIPKTGPNLKSPLSTLGVLKEAGFNLVSLANNHIMDYGAEGLKSTLKNCQEQEIKTVGAGVSLQEAIQPAIIEMNGVDFAIINIAENEFGTTVDDTPGCHPLDPVRNYYAIQEAAQRADYVIVIVHGGHEHYELPSPRMKRTYRFFVDAGANAVVGHHTHCISGYELYKEAPIFYSIGNFLFDHSSKNKPEPTSWHYGMMVQLEISESKVDFSLLPYIQNWDKPGLQKLDDAASSSFRENLNSLNKIISDDKELEKHFNEFTEKEMRRYSSYIEPHSSRVLHALRNRSLLPSFLSERKKRLLLNLTRCEAHRDLLIQTLEK